MSGPRRAFTQAEWSRIQAALQNCPVWERALFRTFADTGLRLKEVCALTVGSVMWRGRIVDMVPVTPMLQKGHYGSTRWIPMTPPWRKDLRDHLKGWGGGDVTLASPKSPLFVRPLKREPTVWVPVTRSFIAQRMRGLLDRAHVFRDRERLSSHTWRKSYAHHVLAAAHGDLFVVRRALNHSSISATEHYAMVSPREVARAIRRADWTRQPRNAPQP